MEDSKASSDGRGRQSRLQGNVNALFEFASRALGRADSRPGPDRLLDDEEFLERLAGKVVEKLDARSAGAVSGLSAQIDALNQAALVPLQSPSQTRLKPQE